MARITWVFLGLLLGMSSLPAHPLQAQDTDPVSAEQGSRPASKKVIVPAETNIPVILRNQISTRSAYVGQSVYCETIFPITVDNQIVIPVGTYVKGSVTQVVRPGRIKGKARLGIRFDSLIFPNGETLSLRSALSAAGTSGKEGFDRKEGRIKGEGTKGRDAQIIAITGAQGAIIGAIAGRGKGVAIGGGAGAAAGLASVLLSRGKDLVLRRGTDLELVLLVPVELPSYGGY